MIEGLLIRSAGMDDLPDLLQLESGCFACDRISRRSYRHLMHRGHADVLAADTQEGILAGSAVLLYRRGSRLARLYSMAVRPDLRGRGVGGLMLATAERMALDKGMSGMGLEVAEGNRPALALYLRTGYIETSRLPGYYESGEAALRMQKTLIRCKV